MTPALRLLLDGLALALTLPVLAGCAYLVLLTVLAWRPPPEGPGAPALRFAVVVPAHDEAAGIAATMRSLAGVDYPPGLRQLLVVADNCSDDTAACARAAGALVLERRDEARRGKGYALAAAFAWALEHGVDAVVVVDADTVVSANLLRAFAHRLDAGAQALQADYRVRNPAASWRTRLMTIALSAFHQVRSLGRARLGVSCGLRGNGMCLRSSLLRAVPYDAFSLVEDLEYGVRLGLAGYRVEYAPEAQVFGEMVAGGEAARSQRLRWEGGRARLRKTHGLALVRRGLLGRDALALDLAFDVLLPPLSQLGLAGLGLLAASGASWGLWGVGRAAELSCLLALGALGAHVLGGWWYSGTGLRGLVDLACAPAYVLWKLALPRAPAAAADAEWIRTRREGSSLDDQPRPEH